MPPGRRTGNPSSTPRGPAGRAHQARAARLAGAPGDAHAIRGLLPRSGRHARWREVVFLSGAVSRSALLDPARHAARGRGEPGAGRDRGDRRHQPAEHAGDPVDPGRRRCLDARRRGAERAAPHFLQNNSTRVYLSRTARPAVDHDQRLRPAHAPARHRLGPGQQPAWRRGNPALARRHARVRVACRASTFVIRVAKPAARPSRSESRGAARHDRAGQADVAGGRRLPAVDRATAQR